MSRQTSGTPCPVSNQPSIDGVHGSFSSIGEDTTNLDFTKAFRSSLQAEKPRRRKMTVGRSQLGFAIHEDERLQNSEPPAQKTTVNSVLARPPQRLCAPEITRHSQNVRQRVSQFGPSSNPERRVSIAPIQPRNKAINYLKHDREELLIRPLAKPARRGTIYIPPEDTTIPSVLMGIFSPINSYDVDVNHEEINPNSAVGLTGIAAQMSKKRRPQRQSLASSGPVRCGPLQPALRVVQEAVTSEDVPGLNSGKENIPPGYKCSSSPDAKGFSSTIDIKVRSIGASKANTSITAASLVRAHTQTKTIVRSNGNTAKPFNEAWNQSSAKYRELSALRIQKATRTLPQHSQMSLPDLSPTVPNKFVVPRIQPPIQSVVHYPVISEDIANPKSYEDNWLAHQEVALTQLVNSLFSLASTDDSFDYAVLRLEMLQRYQGSAFSALQARLKASIAYGALHVSSNIPNRSTQLNDDLGLRKSFVDLWCSTYEHDILRIALEVVVGRQCPTSTRAMRDFIEVFLIRNEDGTPEFERENHASWSRQRTLLRSLMILKLLDVMKTAEGSTYTKCLFKSTSSYKSSVTVVQALAQVLNPNMTLRSLGRFDYILSHVQFPLEEFEYSCNNLAIDLRDGLRLTRLVELLLYPSASRYLVRSRDGEGSATVVIPTGEVLSIQEGHSRWPLSQHLKVPCLGRATKLCNVEVALAALGQVKSMRKVMENIRAVDIVDGHREKTVALVWALTGEWGLAGLLDLQDMKAEIRRLNKKRCDHDMALEEDIEDITQDLQRYKVLLKAWASAVTGSKGLKITNLTTSFADGKAFAAIVDEYEHHLLHNVDRDGNPKKLLLHERLVQVGCSSPFAQLFAPESRVVKSYIFDQDFVTSVLAFLCSRLLSASKRSRAAVVIQRRFHIWHARRLLQRRLMARKLAVDCQNVVCTRERIVRAKMTILRAWRGCKLAGDRNEYYRNEAETDDIWLCL